MRLRDQLNNRKKLGYNRHARVAVRAYYGLPRATANVANQLIDWKNGDTVGSFEKRTAWRAKTWTSWDVAATMRDIAKYAPWPHHDYRDGNRDELVMDELVMSARFRKAMTNRIVFNRSEEHAKTVHD